MIPNQNNAGFLLSILVFSCFSTGCFELEEEYTQYDEQREAIRDNESTDDADDDDDTDELVKWHDSRELYKTTRLDEPDGQDLVWDIQIQGCQLTDIRLAIPTSFEPVKERLTWKTTYVNPRDRRTHQLSNPSLETSQYGVVGIELYAADYTGKHAFASNTQQSDGGYVIHGFVPLFSVSFTPHNLRNFSLRSEQSRILGRISHKEVLVELNEKVLELLNKRDFGSTQYRYDGNFYVVVHLKESASDSSSAEIRPLRAAPISFNREYCI